MYKPCSLLTRILYYTYNHSHITPTHSILFCSMSTWTTKEVGLENINTLISKLKNGIPHRATMPTIPDVPKWIVIWKIPTFPCWDSLNIVPIKIGWNNCLNMKDIVSGIQDNISS